MPRSNYFTRIFKREQVQHCMDMLTSLDGKPRPFTGAETFEEKAPDGDVVFAGLAKNKTTWICRLHREVFDWSEEHHNAS